MAQVKSVAEVYKSVVADVIDGVRESFIDEGVDEHVLLELKQMWENKLRLSKALDSSAESPTRILPPPAHSHHQSKVYSQQTAQLQLQQQQQHLQQQQQQFQQQFQQQQQLLNSVSLANDKTNNNIRTTTTTNNNSATLQQLTSLQGSVLNLGSPNFGQPDGQTISPLLLQHFNNVNCLVQQNASNNRPILIQSAGGGNFVQSQQGIIFGLSNQPVATSATPQNGVTLDPSNVTNIVQLDGLVDSSSEDEQDNNDDGAKRGGKRGKFEEEEEEEEEEETPGQQPDVEDDPLNSDDDEKSDVEAHDHFDTDNVVVCQFDKVNRSKTRWKFHLKDGIMNIAGKDYVFQKATGDAEF